MSRFALVGFAALFAAATALAQEPTLAEPESVAIVEVEEDAVPAEQVWEPATVVAAPGPVCCPIEVVDVRTKLSARRFLRCAGAPVNMTVCVDNPADCLPTLYAVPLCVPCCCVGEPTPCHARTGLLGRGYVDLVWDCGLVAKVTFLKHGGVIITYAAH